MNIQEKDLILAINKIGYNSQRQLSTYTGHSLGSVNTAIKNLINKGYLTETGHLTNISTDLLHNATPKNAIILAAGTGMRMVPINTQVPKGLLEVRGEKLIERLIHQLHEVGITDITVITGFMKEAYEYLIDDFGVNLVFNKDYHEKNNLNSLSLVSNKIHDTYIMPCDVWCLNNPFNIHELYSWYMVTTEERLKSMVKLGRDQALHLIPTNEPGNKMIGISYITCNDGEILSDNLSSFSKDIRYDDAFWEDALFQKDLNIYARTASKEAAVEIDTYKELMELDKNSNCLDSYAINLIKNVFNINSDDISNINVLKAGMTNRSFFFSIGKDKYIMRIPGEGTDQLINRKEEANVYNAVAPYKITDPLVYINPENGYKITRFVEGSRNMNPNNPEDVQMCIELLKKFHSLNLKVDHSFNIVKKINFYESLWGNTPSIYKDYKLTKKNILSLQPFIEKYKEKEQLTHMDAVPDNFLKTNNEIYLIDWEYASMQDPHVDIAMFAIYALYDKTQVDNLIDVYFNNNCPKTTRLKIYAYIAQCGLLWSNWCEYKRNLGVEFGEYSIKQYRYAKEYYRYVIREIEI